MRTKEAIAYLENKGFFAHMESAPVTEIEIDGQINVSRSVKEMVYVVKKGVSVSIYETIKGDNPDTKTVLIGLDHSNIRYYVVNENEEHTGTVDIFLWKNANINSNIIELASSKALIRSNLHFLEPGAHADANSVAIGTGIGDFDLAIQFIHLAKNTSAVMNNYGIAKDRSKILYTGISRIEKGNSKTDSYQKTRGLNLSKDAKVTARPYLYIDEYDVIAGHGASIGSVREDDLFYLMSRGLKREEAEKMIIGGFIKPIIDNISDEAFQAALTEAIDKRLG